MQRNREKRQKACLKRLPKSEAEKDREIKV